MAITTDTGAKKIENSENWRNIFGIHNDTVDAYDALAEQKDEEIGIVVKGNKTAHTGGAAAGQFVILRNSTITGCDDGLYKAAQAIPYDTAIDSTYLTPVSGGGLNALNASLIPVQVQLTLSSKVTSSSLIAYKINKILLLSGLVTINSPLNGRNEVVITLPNDCKPITDCKISIVSTYGNTRNGFPFTAKADGTIITDTGTNTFTGDILLSCAIPIE